MKGITLHVQKSVNLKMACYNIMFLCSIMNMFSKCIQVRNAHFIHKMNKNSFLENYFVIPIVSNQSEYTRLL